MKARKLSPGKNAPNHDLVYTPRSLAKEIIDHYQPSGRMLDPSKGGGAFYDQFPPGETFWCELQEGRDFFAFHEKMDWIITNPPWSKVMDFLIHGMEISDNIVYLLTINHMTTKARMRKIYGEGFGFKEIYGVKQPKENWPASGFQLAAVHIKKGWNSSCVFTGTFGF